MSHIRTRLHNGILWLILDCPPLNILSPEMLDQLSAAMRKALELEPRLVVLMGAGERAFSAGVDVRDHLDGREKEMLRAVAENCAAFAALRARGIATVALVKGVALGGGCELAALCDTVLAHEQATFGLPEIGLGVFPPVASAYFPQLLGYQTTMRLMLTGETISAREALRLGLVHQVLSERRFLPDAEELLVMLASTRQEVGQ
ncbi:MAG TPA: enoyl-CoA hydratase/isomerase family protein [Ktedonobacteraceae bacterium]|jgi:enoyl-CoA hydratase/carnithine racemase|nr:enoyl-CoA hydratase/isomerase family protein [Ktedonobacteraceae bacterium]